MLQIKNLTVTLRKDLRVIIDNFSFVLNQGDKAVIVGEEGNGKSTLLKVIYDAVCGNNEAQSYADIDGEILFLGRKMGCLRQDMEGGEISAAAYFAQIEGFEDLAPWELLEAARELGLNAGIFDSTQLISTLSGGERVKIQLARLLLEKPDVYLLDEPSNDIDIETLEWLERFINKSPIPVLYVSHDETLVENTANTVIHMELVRRKTTARATVARAGYREYVDRREAALAKQTSRAKKEKEEHNAKMERYRRIEQSVTNKLDTISKADRDAAGRLLKKKMGTVKSMGRRFEREKADMTQLPDFEEEIFLKFDENLNLANGKTVLDFNLPLLEQGGRILARDIALRVTGPEKICIVGKNGAGKSSLIKIIAGRLLERRDIQAGYMPQDYEDLLDISQNPIEFLAPSGVKADVTKARTLLGSVKYTADEMSNAIGDLSGGQKGKLLLLKMILNRAEVLILDEPTRNFSPLSNPVLRGVLKEFGGAIISVSHDRKFIDEVCDKVYVLTETGLEAR